jgi:DNA (cytosine-5)-methyltransferase 1
MEDFANLEFIDEHIYTKLKVGTDCSGIEAPIQALTQLGIPFTHVFSSDIDKFCIQSIKANYEPQIIFGDKDGPFPNGNITTRSIDNVPDIDLYVCGFPCQPFSQAGEKKGFDDKRGNVFWSCLEVIEKKQPKYFILENVKGLLGHDKPLGAKRKEYGNTFNVIWAALLELEKYGYNVQWKVMNTKDYGIPQNRERVYFVGTKGINFVWPDKVKMDELKNYVDWKDDKKGISHYDFKKFEKCFFINLKYIKLRSFTTAHKFCPCLVCQSSAFWCIPLHRMMNIKEYKGLQGFQQFKQVVSNSQLQMQLGNSMSVNVVKLIISNLLKT